MHTPPGERSAPNARAALATLPALLLTWWQTRLVWPFFSDDAFISLRFSARLLAGDGLTWTDGERVEGYSNLLWVLLCAALGATGIDLVDAARLLGGVATALGMFALARALRPHDARTTVLATLPPLLAASTQVVLGWTFGGLEGPLLFCLLAFGFSALVRAIDAEPTIAAWPRSTLLLASVPFALACWTRPDAPLWVATIAAALALATAGSFGKRCARAAVFAALPFTAFLLQLGFRLAYHGDFVPNTAHVKAGFDASALPAGLDYVMNALRAHCGIAIVAAVGLLLGGLHRATRPKVLLLALPLVAWFAYLVAIGGDHFPGRRLLHATVAPLALLALGAMPSPPRTWLQVVAASILVALFGALGVERARNDAQTTELRGEVWEWRGKVTGEMLQRAFGEQRPLLAVDAAGAVPFYSRLPSLDLLGLCDRTIATTPEPAWIATMRPEIPRPPGHRKGNGRYVLDRAPDLLLFSNPPGLPLPVFVSACEMEYDARFLEGYRCVRIDLGLREILPEVTEPLVVPLWIAREGRSGVQRNGDEITIPAYLFGAYQQPEPIVRRHQPATADAAAEARVTGHIGALFAFLMDAQSSAVPAADGRLQLRRTTHGTSALRLPLPAGTWEVAVVPATNGVVVGARGEKPGRVSIPGEGATIDLELQTTPDAQLPCCIDAITLRRRDR